MVMNVSKLIYGKLPAISADAGPKSDAEIARISAAAQAEDGVVRYISREKEANAVRLETIERMSSERRKNGLAPEWSIFKLPGRKAAPAGAPAGEVPMTAFDGTLEPVVRPVSGMRPKQS